MDVPLKPRPKSAEQNGKIPILLVDDQPANLLALESLLEHDEYALVKARSGTDALRCMLHKDFALVLLDVLMPDMDGFETAALIRKRKRSMDTPIIFITASNTNENHVSRGYSLGAVDYIYKPIVADILRAKVQVFVDLHRKTARLIRSEEALRLELAERKKAEEARRESEEKYREIFSRASDAIIIFDSAGKKVLDANEAALKLYGYSRKEFLRLTAQDLEAEPEKRENEQPPRMVDGSCRREFIRRQKTRGRQVFPAEISRGTFTLQGKKMAMALVRDITERIDAEEAERLKERDVMHRQFVATVSHELRTPITVIKASAETLRRYGAEDAQIFPRNVEIIVNRADKLGALVEDLLALAELESGNIRPMPTVTALPDFIRQCVDDIKVLAAQKDVSVDIDINEAVVAWADQSHLARILQNLLDNAIKYNKKGGSVRVECRRANDHEVQVSIRDTGIGIQAKDMPLIFQPFHRTEKARASAIGGTGLGLYIIKNIVESNGGRIWAESAGHQGSTFHFTMPLATQSGCAAAA